MLTLVVEFESQERKNVLIFRRSHRRTVCVGLAVNCSRYMHEQSVRVDLFVWLNRRSQLSHLNCGCYR